MAKLSVAQLLKFVKFTHQYQQIERIIFVTNQNRNENDSEHSFQLALLSWYLIASQSLDYDLDQVIKYALIHDLVETYAGDSYFWRNNQEKDNKKEREAKSLAKINKILPEFFDLTSLISQYEKQGDREAEFVYALDKMIPVLNIYLDKGRSWHRDKVKFDMIRAKDEKIKINNDVLEIWLKFMKLVEKDRKSLFP